MGKLLEQFGDDKKNILYIVVTILVFYGFVHYMWVRESNWYQENISGKTKAMHCRNPKNRNMPYCNKGGGSSVRRATVSTRKSSGSGNAFTLY